MSKINDKYAGKYAIVRTQFAGVFAGTIEFVDDSGQQVTALVTNARRLWSWAGAASLSQMAMTGTNAPTECKFPTEVDEVFLPGVIEILPCTEAARASIASVKVWSA